MLKIKVFLSVLIIAITGFFGWSLYGYLFIKSNPKLEILGIENNNCYAGNVSCLIKGSDEYKVSNISISLDNKLLVPKHKISKKEFEYNFNVPTETLNEGEHNLFVEVENGTYHKNKTIRNVKFIVDNTPLNAAFVKDVDDVKVFQGRTLHIQFQTNKQLSKAVATYGTSSYKCFPESENSLIYECYLPIDCEEIPNEYLLSVNLEDKVGNNLVLKNKFKIVQYPFKKQRIKIATEKIKKENETGKPEKELETILKDLAEKSPSKKLWQGNFIAPTEIQQITTEFGVTRVTQERGLRQHKAVDVYNTPKAPIWASQDGIIVLKDRFAHSGNTIGIDHGYGLISLYYHLDEFADGIKVGDKIKKGYKIGTLGKTGYATGYHLHWEMRLNNIAIDPMEWIKPNF